MGFGSTAAIADTELAKERVSEQLEVDINHPTLLTVLLHRVCVCD